jgi:hypothetical protein
MNRRLLLAAFPALLAAARGAPTGTPADFPVLNVAAVPGLDQAGRIAYRRFLMMDTPRAFALAAGGVCGAAGEALSDDAARQQALAQCARAGGRNARVYAQDLEVVWTHAPIAPNHSSPLAPAPPRPPLIETWNYSFIPDARFFWRGPASAKGVYIWAHGTSTDPLGLQPPPHVRVFNNAGYDIVRFDRVPNADDVDRAALWLRQGIAFMRKSGWRRVIAGGHSRGGWNCLQMVKFAGLADALIAESPAAHGVASGFYLSSQTDDLRQIVDRVPPTRTRLVFIQFRDDPFIGDPDTRLHLVESLRPRLGGLLVIDRPAGFAGHYAARALGFAERFGDALLGVAA